MATDRPWDPADVALVLFALIVAALVVAVAASLGTPIPKLYNEGWNAFFAARAMAGEPLYPDPPALFINNYPPLSFYLVGSLGAALGDHVVAGRVVSLLSFGAVALAVAAIVHHWTASRRAAAVAALACAGSLLALQQDTFVGANEPQLLGHAFAMAGLFLLLRGRGAWGPVVAAACLMAAAGWIKHNLFVLPLAVTLWLLLTDRAAFARWLASAALLGAASLAALALIADGAVLDGLLTPRDYSLDRLLVESREALVRVQIPLALGLLLAIFDHRCAETRLVALYGGLALVIGVLLMGGYGVTKNALFDLMIALGLAAGLAFHRARGGGGATLRRPALVGATLVALLALNTALAAPLYWLRALVPGYAEQIHAVERASRLDIAYLAAAREPVICEALALCYWAGKRPELDPFNARQSFLAGTLDEALLLARLARREFAVVQLTKLPSPERDDERFSRAFMAALHRHYVQARSSPNGDFFVPAPPPPATATAGPG